TRVVIPRLYAGTSRRGMRLAGGKSLSRWQPREGGEQQDDAGCEEALGITEAVDEDPDEDGPDDRAGVHRHLEPGEDATPGAMVADDVGDGGLLRRVEDAGSRSGDEAQHEDDPDRADVSEHQRRDPADHQATDDGRPAPDAVRETAGEGEGEGVARGEGRDRDAGELGRAVLEVGVDEDRGDEERDDRGPHTEVRPAVGEAGDEDGPEGRVTE